eukprot:2078866-Prymnesium_polylepis.1
MGKKKAEGLRLNSLAAVATVAQFVNWSETYMWRTKCEFWTRVTLAWMYNLFLYLLFSVAALTYGMIKFQGSATEFMLLGWAVAACQTYIILEPAMVVLVVVLPFIVNEETRCGRCCLRIQFWYMELFAP